MKILHTSDWHLGHQLYRYDRTEEQTAFLDQLVERVAEERPDVLLVCGDVYHTSQPSAAVQTLFAKTMVRLHEAHPALVTVVTAGNHDSGSRHEVFRLPWQALGVHAIGQLDKQDLDRHIVEIPNIGFVVAIPYVHESFLPDGFFQQVLDRALARNRAAYPDKLLPVVLTAHLTLQGCDYTGHESAFLSRSEETTTEGAEGADKGQTETAKVQSSDNQRCNESEDTNKKSKTLHNLPNENSLNTTESSHDSQIDSETTGPMRDCTIGGIDAYSLDRLGEGYDYLALGHIHRPQFVHSGHHNVRYSGTPLAVSFDEAYPHSISMVEIAAHGEKPQVRVVEINNPHPLVTLPTRGTATWEEAQQLLKAFPKEQPAYLRVKVAVEDFLPPEAPMQAEALCRDKQARFCVLQAVRTAKTKRQQSTLTVEEFRREDPLDLVRRYADDKGICFDNEMEALFREAVAALAQSDETAERLS